MKIIKIGLWIAIISVIGFVLWKYYWCTQKGKKEGKVYKCSLFSSDPTWLSPLDEYFMMIRKKCYEVVDYGERMEYKIVELENCGETQPIKRSDSLAEYEIVDEG